MFTWFPVTPRLVQNCFKRLGSHLPAVSALSVKVFIAGSAEVEVTLGGGGAHLLPELAVVMPLLDFCNPSTRRDTAD